jgi:hypothetical protein
MIAESIEACMNAHERNGIVKSFDVDGVTEMDRWAREFVRKIF